jgi:hypothetical protein
MKWFLLFLAILAAGAILSVLISPPTILVDWFLSKFEIHPKISDATISLDGKLLKGKDKLQIIEDFNNALFVQRYGFHPETSGTPLIINVKNGKNHISFFIYSYNEHVDVFRKGKKKVVAYRLLSKGLQERFALSLVH